MKKRLFAVMLSAAAGLMLLAGCSSPAGSSAPAGGASSEAASETAVASEAASGTEAAETEAGSEGAVYKVGVVSFVDHASLNQIQENVLAELDKKGEELGVVFDYENRVFNGGGDASVLNQIGAQLISEDVDAIVAIATPTAQVMQSVAEDSGTPVIFSAVTDPEGAGLVASNEAPGANITGTSDALNTEAVMNLILANDPEIGKVGLLYSKSEDASTRAIAEAKAFLEGKGIEFMEKTGTTTDEISAAVDALIAGGVQAVFTPTDNTIMNAELAIYEKFLDAGIPHYAGADSFALNGAFLGFGINYADLGTATGDIVADILAGGQDTASYSVITLDNGIASINTDTAAALGYDMDVITEAFAPFCSEIKTLETAEEF